MSDEHRAAAPVAPEIGRGADREPLEGSTADARAPRLGILGGMGPLASAELLRTLYRLNRREREQECPACVLSSDPDMPDRTAAILSGQTAELARRIDQALGALLDLGCDRLVVACVTAHHVFDQLGERARSRLVSLLDLMAAELLSDPRPRLLLATEGVRASRLFERHPAWPALAPGLALLEETDQRRLHEWIYRLKRGEAGGELVEWLVGDLAPRYGVEGFVFGCTELHLLHDLMAHQGPRIGEERIVDPLWIVARDARRLLAAAPGEPPRTVPEGAPPDPPAAPR